MFSLNIVKRLVGFHETAVLNKDRSSILCLDGNLVKGSTLVYVDFYVQSDPHNGTAVLQRLSSILFYNNFHSFPQILHRICSQRKPRELKAVFFINLPMSTHINLSPVLLAIYLRRCFAKNVTDLTCEISIIIEYTFSIN